MTTPRYSIKQEEERSRKTIDRIISDRSARGIVYQQSIIMGLGESFEVKSNYQAASYNVDVRVSCALHPRKRISPCIIKRIILFTKPRPKDLVQYALVERLWSDIIRASPELWTNVRVVSSNLDRAEEIFDYLLNKSGYYPIDVYLDLSREIPYQFLQPQVLIKIATCSRMKTLDISFPFLDWLTVFWSMGRHQDGVVWPYLERIKILSSYELTHALAIYRDPMDQKLAFPKMPKLRELKLEIPIAIDADSWRFPWGQLSKLSLSVKNDYVDYANILAACPRLTSCGIQFNEYRHNLFRPNQYELDASSSIVLPLLENLYLIFPGKDSDLRDFMKQITVPKLKMLRVQILKRTGPVAFPIIQMMNRSHCRLEALHLRGIGSDDTDLPELLERAKKFRYVSLTLPKVHSNLLQNQVLFHLTNNSIFDVVVPIDIKRMLSLEILRHFSMHCFTHETWGSWRIRTPYEAIKKPEDSESSITDFFAEYLALWES